MGYLRMEVLTEAELERLHRDTLTVLDRTGIKVGHGPTRDKLARAGARVDEGDTVHLPPEMVEELLRQAPREVRFATVSGEILQIGGENRYYSSITMDPKIIDYERGPRPPVLEDVRRLTILGDALERVSVMSLMEYPPSDMPGPKGYLKCLEIFATHMTKHVVSLPTSLEAMEQRTELAHILADGAAIREKPVMSFAATMTSPLTMTEVNAVIFEKAVEGDFPLFSVICPMAGTTSPYSFAGSLVTANAEALFPIILAQVLEPGYPVLYGHDPSVTDLRSGDVLYYSPDKFLFRLAGAQVGRFYKLPVKGGFIGTMVGRYDPQNGIESALFALVAAAGRHNLNGSLGSNFNANGTSEEQAVMGNGLADIVERLYRGITVDDRHIGLDAIHRTGPGGHYMEDEMTLDLLHSGEFLNEGVMNFSGQDCDENSLMEKAHARACELIDSHKPSVPESIANGVREFIRREERKLES